MREYQTELAFRCQVSLKTLEVWQRLTRLENSSRDLEKEESSFRDTTDVHR